LPLHGLRYREMSRLCSVDGKACRRHLL